MLGCGPACKLTIFFTFCYTLWILPGVNLKCFGTDTPFDILPEGDHIIEYGSVFTLFCKLNKSHSEAKGLDSKDLLFYTLRDKKENLSNITILNDTTIKVDLVSPPLGSTYYYCSLNNTKPCLTNVLVGYKPQPVLDFQCVSYNWEKLFCHWRPQENPIKTVYKLNYTLRGKSGGTPSPCPKQLDVKNNSCFYDHYTTPSYRQPHEYYNFELFGQNALGNLSRNYIFHHYECVIPNKSEDVTVINKTVSSATLEWKIPYPVYDFPPGLRFKIEYKNKWEDWMEVHVPKNLKIREKNYTYSITGLKYANTVYDVRVYLKSYVAKPGPDFWSLPASTIFRTLPTIPYNSPSTTQGSFEVVSNGNDTDVFIYWARIPERFENGDGFTYNVDCLRDDGENCGPPIEKSASFAKFSFNSHHGYKFTIYSVNIKGRSLNSSYVFVPKYGSFIQPESFTKVAYDNGVFELSWKSVRHPQLSNYTIFWCKEEKDTPVPCKGYLDWLVVSKDTVTQNITMGDVTKFYKFAIAANLIDGTSSGMVWSSCVIFHDKVLRKVDDFRISRVGVREVDVVWEIRCAQSSAFKGFAFYYCPVDFAAQDNNCKNNTTEEVMKLNGSQERNVTLKNLKPYTTYKLQISIISLDGSHQIQIGPRSMSKRFFTLNDAPSEPLNLSVIAVSNSSVSLSWENPKEMNGILQTYKLYVESMGSQSEIKFSAQNPVENSIIKEYKIDNLVSFTTYNFTLKACTSIDKCSNSSHPAVVKTLIGVPGKMMRPQVSVINTSLADVSWEWPMPPAGHLDYYQLLITVKEESVANEIFNLTGSRAKVYIKACKDKYRTPEFRIRAINLNKYNLSYYGPWSEPTEVHCGFSVWAENSVLIDWISGTCTLVIVSGFLIYFIKKGWVQCRKMKDVEVKLPSGLQSQDLEKDNQDYVHLEPWPPRSPDTLTGSEGTVVAPDEESLLDKKSDESMDNNSFNMPVKNGGDSGCSVGRESVSSSITSDTHISSDSGSEPDQCTIKAGPFELWNSGKKNGNVGNVKNILSRESVNSQKSRDWEEKEKAIPGYTKVGFNSFIPGKNVSNKGYTTIEIAESLNPLQKTSSAYTGNFSSENHFRPQISNSFSSGSVDNNNCKNQSLATPKYVSLVQFEGQKIENSTIPIIKSDTGRSSQRELPMLSRLDESSERDIERTEGFNEEDISGKETDTVTIHEVPVTKSKTSMPPYISMMDNPKKCFRVNDDDEDDDNDNDNDDDGDNDNEENKENEGEDKEIIKLASEATGSKVNLNGVDSDLAIKNSKDKEYFSNYIPHHLFVKESVNT